MPEPMKDPTDERWCDLGDARSAGDELAEDELAFLRRHADDSPERAAESRLLSGVEELGALAPPSEADRAIARAALAELRDEASIAGGDVIALPRRTVVTAVGAAALAAAAAVALWFGPEASEPEAPGPMMAVAPAEPALGPTLRTGALAVAGTPLGVGAKVPAGDWLEVTADGTCIDGLVCADAGAELQIQPGEHGPALDVRRGRVRVDGHLGRLQVVTHKGTVASDGGRFTVEVDGPEVVVVVLVGPVTIRDGAGERVLESGDEALLGSRPTAATPELEPTEPPPAPAAPSRPASAEELLARAQSLKLDGDLRRAASTYEQLLRAHPESPEAHAAAVTLGKIQLQRGQARAAVRAFDRYLERGGPLEAEAAYERIRALDRLGDDVRRDVAIEELTRRWPDSVYAQKLGRD